MEVLPEIMSWLDSRMRVVKRNLKDLVEDPVGHTGKQVTNVMEDTATFIKDEEDPMKWAEKLVGVGSFRPTASKLLPSIQVHLLRMVWGKAGYDAHHRDVLGALVGSKISPSAMAKYGAPEFPLDKYLAHVSGYNPELALRRLQAEEYPLSTFLAETDRLTTKIRNSSESIVGNKSSLAKEPNLTDLAFYAREYGPDVRAFVGQIKDKQPIFQVWPSSALDDIDHAIQSVSKILETSPYTTEQLSKKSMDQLLGVVKQIEAKQTKDIKVIADFTKQRTAQLNTEQGLPPGFVELKTKADLGAETEFMNNCSGAGGAHPTSGKFLPKWHPITGEQLIKDIPSGSSADKYWKGIESGNIRMFSYRPEGLPEVTIQVDTRLKRVTEVAGKDNGNIPVTMKDKIDEFTDAIRHGWIK